MRESRERQSKPKKTKKQRLTLPLLLSFRYFFADNKELFMFPYPKHELKLNVVVFIILVQLGFARMSPPLPLFLLLPLSTSPPFFAYLFTSCFRSGHSIRSTKIPTPANVGDLEGHVAQKVQIFWFPSLWTFDYGCSWGMSLSLITSSSLLPPHSLLALVPPIYFSPLPFESSFVPPV